MVVVSSEMMACGGQKWSWKSRDCVAAIGAVTFSSTGEDDRSKGAERKMLVVLRRVVGGRTTANSGERERETRICN